MKSISEWGIHPEKLSKAWKSLTVILAGISALLTNFFMNHPEFIDQIVNQIASPAMHDIVKAIAVDFITAGGFAGVLYGRIRNGKPLEDR